MSAREPRAALGYGRAVVLAVGCFVLGLLIGAAIVRLVGASDGRATGGTQPAGQPTTPNPPSAACLQAAQQARDIFASAQERLGPRQQRSAAELRELFGDLQKAQARVDALAGRCATGAAPSDGSG